jgi:hypothetical protein
LKYTIKSPKKLEDGKQQGINREKYVYSRCISADEQKEKSIIQICTLGIESESVLHLQCIPEASVDGPPKSVCFHKIRSPILVSNIW